MTLAAGDRARVNAQLALGQAEQTITVESTTPALQTDDSTIGTLITSQATQDLPLNGRNVTSLITLAAGVTGGLSNAMNSGTRPDDRRQSSSFAANGQSDEINNNMIDGMDNNERFIGSVGVRPSIDAIEEVKVLTNLYTAEISRTGGGVVDLITKSGGNKFHGTLYEFLRNDKFDARDYFATTGPKPELRQNQFGGSIGGPIRKEKTFFFFDYEGFRVVKGDTAPRRCRRHMRKPTREIFSDLGAGCVNLTTKAGFTPDPIGLNYFKLYPAPNNAVVRRETAPRRPTTSLIRQGRRRTRPPMTPRWIIVFHRGIRCSRATLTTMNVYDPRAAADYEGGRGHGKSRRRALWSQLRRSRHRPGAQRSFGLHPRVQRQSDPGPAGAVHAAQQPVETR